MLPVLVETNEEQNEENSNILRIPSKNDFPLEDNKFIVANSISKRTC